MQLLPQQNTGMFFNGLCLPSPQSSEARTWALVFLFAPLLWPRGQQVWWVSTPSEECWVYAAAALTLPFKSVPSFTETQYRSQVHSSTSSLAAYNCGIPFQFVFIKAVPAQGTTAVRDTGIDSGMVCKTMLKSMGVALRKRERAEVGQK